MPPKRAVVGIKKPNRGVEVDSSGDGTDHKKHYSEHDDSDDEGEYPARPKKKPKSKPATTLPPKRGGGKAGVKTEGTSKGNLKVHFNPRGQAINAFKAVVANQQLKMDDLEKKVDERQAKINRLLDGITTDGPSEQDMLDTGRVFTTRMEGFEKILNLFDASVYANMESKLGDAKVYFNDTRSRKISETRKDITSELKHTQEKAEHDADTKERSRAMIRGIRDSMRAAAGSDRERSRSYSTGSSI